jgi:hypothetical protein
VRKKYIPFFFFSYYVVKAFLDKKQYLHFFFYFFSDHFSLKVVLFNSKIYFVHISIPEFERKERRSSKNKSEITLTKKIKFGIKIFLLKIVVSFKCFLPFILSEKLD